MLCICFAKNLFKYKKKGLPNILQISRCKSCQLPKTLFFGTDNFSLPSLKRLHQSNVDIAVVTSFKSPANCVRIYADQQKLPLFRWPIGVEQCSTFELGVVVSFGHMIPLQIINAFPRGLINVHASLLPRWRGAAPIIYAIMNGDAITGISIMKIQPHQFDTGPILDQKEMHIKNDVYLPELYTALAHLGAELLQSSMHNLDEQLSKAQPQNEKLASYAPKITPQLTEVVWSEQTALEIFTLHRALYGFKNITTKFMGRQVQLRELMYTNQKVDGLINLSPGFFYFNRVNSSLIIGCAKGTHLEVKQLRMEGKKIMSALDFNNGFLKQGQSLTFFKNKNVSIL